jgi:hypothetical protein
VEKIDQDVSNRPLIVGDQGVEPPWLFCVVHGHFLLKNR